MPGPKLVPLMLSDAERESLEGLARKRTASPRRRSAMAVPSVEDY